MLAGESHLDRILKHYPEELRERLKQDIRELLQRDRRFLQSQLQMLASAYSRSDGDFDVFRNSMDALFRENPDDVATL